MYQYTIYCTEEQTKKALELSAPIEVSQRIEKVVNRKYFSDLSDFTFTIIPTAEQMLGWLEVQGFHFDFEYMTMTCCMVQYNHEYINNPICGTRKEATLAGIDAALEYLTNKKIK